MKTILFILSTFVLSNIINAQSQIGYCYNYEITIETSQLKESDPKFIVRDFIDHIFSQQSEKFNLQMRYNETGTFFISSNLRINEFTVANYFKSTRTEILSFEEIENSKESKVGAKNNFALN